MNQKDPQKNPYKAYFEIYGDKSAPDISGTAKETSEEPSSKTSEAAPEAETPPITPFNLPLSEVFEKAKNIDFQRLKETREKIVDNPQNFPQESQIDNLVAFGLIPSDFGQKLKQKYCKAKELESPLGNVFEEFEKSEKAEADFFKNRTPLKNYLENYSREAGENLSLENLAQIKNLVGQIEQNAISKFVSDIENAQKLEQANETAKQKLKTNSSQGSKGVVEAKKHYTRQDIARMSSKEFRENESAIMRQLTQGEL